MQFENTRQIVDELLSKKIDTVEYYFGDEDSLSGEREKLHEEIITGTLSKQYSTRKRVYMLGGAPANGKSSFLNSTHCSYPNTALRIDPDEIKKQLPEYNVMVAMSEMSAASVVHEESSAISKKLWREALKQGIDLILDGVADDTLANRKAVFDEFKANAYYVRMDYVTLDTALSLKIAEIRAQQTGREVPEDFIVDMNLAIAQLVPQLLENQLFDELYLWDTNEPDDPRLVLQQINSNLEVLDEMLYDNFLKKAYE